MFHVQVAEQILTKLDIGIVWKKLGYYGDRVRNIICIIFHAANCCFELQKKTDSVLPLNFRCSLTVFLRSADLTDTEKLLALYPINSLFHKKNPLCRFPFSIVLQPWVRVSPLSLERSRIDITLLRVYAFPRQALLFARDPLLYRYCQFISTLISNQV